MQLKKLAVNNFNLIIFLISALVIIAFLSSQYLFGLKPCKLCLWQRYPYYALSLMFLLAICFDYRNIRILAVLSIIIFTISMALSFYHMLIEYGVIENYFSCFSDKNNFATEEDLGKYLKGKINIACEVPQFKMLLTLSGWNFVFSLFMNIYSTFLLVRSRQISK
jgi:disulfide bond formation protein DsbB